MEPPDRFKRYIPDNFTAWLERYPEPSEHYVSRLQDATDEQIKNRSSSCAVCKTHEGDEQPNDFYDPDRFALPFKEKTLGFKLHSTFVYMDCCRLIVHKQCLLLWIAPDVIQGRFTKNEIHNTCPHCSHKLYDSIEDLIQLREVKMLVGMLRDCSFYDIRDSLVFMPCPAVKPLLTCVRMALYVKLIGGSLWASDSIGREVGAAMEYQAALSNHNHVKDKYNNAHELRMYLVLAAVEVIRTVAHVKSRANIWTMFDVPSSLIEFIDDVARNATYLCVTIERGDGPWLYPG